MNKEQIIAVLQAYFSDWESGVAEQVADDAIKDFGIDAIDKFVAVNYYQEQSNIINVLEAIRG